MSKIHVDPDLMDITDDPTPEPSNTNTTNTTNATNAFTAAENDDDDRDDDPITASYQVFLNPSLPLGRRLLVLQHPNRTDNAPRPPPTEMRLKAASGMVEVDIPVDNTTAYDREKGLKWGRALQTSMVLKNGGSHGLAGGFGVGAVQQRAPPRKKGDGADHNNDDDGLDWNEAVRQGKVLSTQTLGGQYPDADEVQYMVGVFNGKDLHLTPVSSLVHLRPQLHHLDATAQLERQHASSAAAKDAAPAGSSARAIHMSIKTTTDGDGVSTETMADRLRSVQSEPWRKMRYTDENEETAWEVYNESLFLRAADPENENAQGGDGNRIGNGNGNGDGENERALEELVPALGTKWQDQQFLEAVSGFKKPVPVVVDAAATTAAAAGARGVVKTETSATPAPYQRTAPQGAAAAEDARSSRARGSASSAPAAARRGGRARPSAS